MRALIEHIANMLKIDLKDPYALADIAQVKELEGFKTFIEDNFNDIRLKFANPIEKFLLLRKMYYEELNRDRLENAHKVSFAIGEKFRELKPQLRELEDKDILTRYLAQNIDGEMVRCFTDFENNALGKIGTIKRLIYLDDNHKLEEELDKVFSSVVYYGKETLRIEQKKQNNTLGDERLDKTVNTALNRI